MMNVWAILSENKFEVIEQDDPPTVSWSGGRESPLFPLYIQCRSQEDAMGVRNIHRPLVALYNAFADEVELARAIHHSLNCSSIMSDVSVWFIMLNGLSFRGILISNSDLDGQTRNFRYRSWRKGGSFKEALMIMALQGEKQHLTAIKASPPPASPASTSFEHLSISSLSLQDDSERFIMSPPVSACGRKVTQNLDTTTNRPGPSNRPGSSHQNIPTTNGRKAKPRAPPMLKNFRQQSVFPARLSNRVYKYIRSAAGTVGTIHDESGVVSHLTSEEYRALGSIRAAYLDSHGYGVAEVEQILYAFEAPTVGEFIGYAEGCGMSVVELEWFWNLE
ncbi:hypothetical protein BJ322DRAFT_1105594 [Thelephora terrestris]|uniref:Uncharacterized protein n=1 Tax=Thelephora terrestris TaxID=56493 RepID=A0A9P6LAQ1_9AGAM|nr:hypothetical protein BJ322DRAFT_1105594 [Thelephora terrestris]